MQSPARGRSVWWAASLALVVLLGGCAHMHWPWHHPAPAPPAPVHVLDIQGGTYPQYWKRNTLLVDITSASGSGSITLKPAEGEVWPVRLALRVAPGAFPVLDVRGDQRQNLPISASGSAPIDLELAPSVYAAKTPQVVVSWGTPVAPPTPAPAPVQADPAVTPH